MVTLTWHWNAPTDLYNTAEQPWWKGFYTTATSFGIAWVMNNPDSEKYQLILRDIDAIAEQLKIYQQNKIPVLWRPLKPKVPGSGGEPKDPKLVKSCGYCFTID